MHTVNAMYSMSRGTPAVSGVTWYKAVSKVAQKKSPFSGSVAPMILWQPDERGEGAGERANVYYNVAFDSDEKWSELHEQVKGRSAAIHDGLFFELCALVLDEERAWSMRTPSWITKDRGSLMFELPSDVVKWLVTASPSEADSVVKRWALMPYMSAVCGGVEDVGETLVALMARVARSAFEHECLFMLEASGYALP